MGHMIVANLVRECTPMQEVWFVVSPHNPHKKKSNLLHEQDRYDMVQRAVSEDYGFRVSDIEFHLPYPSYTSVTLAHLSDQYPQHNFSLIIGEDNLVSFPKWRNHEAILTDYGLIVYPRPNAPDSALRDSQHVQMIEAPMMDISASLIRRLVREGRSVKYLVPEAVEKMIAASGFYL